MAVAKQYIYIVQSSKEKNVCKIGITDNYGRRLKEYNNITGVSKDVEFKYMFVGEVKDMKKLENAIKKEFSANRAEKNKEMYLYNEPWFNIYVDFIKRSQLFIKEILIKEDNKNIVTKIVKRNKPSLEERGVTSQELLKKARKVDNDEFYTRLEDVEKELSMYPKSIWKNKTVFCNCDDAVGDTEIRTSAFPLYFIKNFRELELKKLICTHYSGTVDLFNQGARGYVFTKFGYREIDFKKEYPEGYTGSFDHPLSLKILKEEADIVCTNPPFSRTIDYWKLVIESGKKFLIISNVVNAVSTAYIHYFMNNKVWAGYNEVDWFLTPKKELTRAAGFWYTNINIKDRPRYKQLKIMPLKDIPSKYKNYDDANILVVNNGYIPSDYKKKFAVSARPILNGLLEKGYKIVEEKKYHPPKNGKEGFAKVLVQKE